MNNMQVNPKKDRNRKNPTPRSSKDTVNLRKTKDFIPDLSTKGDINTDPLGSWTGVPTDDPYEKPVQDADDL